MFLLDHTILFIPNFNNIFKKQDCWPKKTNGAKFSILLLIKKIEIGRLFSLKTGKNHLHQKLKKFSKLKVILQILFNIIHSMVEI